MGRFKRTGRQISTCPYLRKLPGSRAILGHIYMRRIAFGCLLATLCLADSGAGIQWTAPAAWKADAQRPMRLATYTVAPGAECAVYFFGAGQGGSVDANLDRWIGQFQQPDGKPSKSAAKIAKKTAHGWPLTTVDVAGAYTGMGGPTAPAGAPAMPGYRMLAAIVEGPQGSVFFKFTGPAKVVAANQAAFDKMLESLGPMR
jgi:hypothetical protein